jgi:hypothetical protein
LVANAQHNTLKIVDKLTLDAEIVKQTMRDWGDYDGNMKEIIANYMKLVYLVQFSKKEGVHRVIRQSANALACRK